MRKTYVCRKRVELLGLAEGGKAADLGPSAGSRLAERRQASRTRRRRVGRDLGHSHWWYRGRRDSRCLACGVTRSSFCALGALQSKFGTNPLK